MASEEIHINWYGPFGFCKIKEGKLDEKTSDSGLYQVYGVHPLYGPNALLYIGQAADQTFHKRILQECWWETEVDRDNLQFYVGRITSPPSTRTLTRTDWQRQIDRAERLLIYAHGPTYNTTHKKSPATKDPLLTDLAGTAIFNWEQRRSLFPVVCADAYIGRFFNDQDDHWPDYAIHAD